MLDRALPQPVACAQRIGNSGGGGVLDQSTFTSPAFVSWNETTPADVTAPSGFPRPSVVHASVKDVPFWDFTVTFSSVDTGA